MRIALISPTLPPSNSVNGVVGGAETYVFNLAKELAEFKQDVTLFSVSDFPGIEHINPNLTCYYLKRSRLFSSSVYDSNSIEILKVLEKKQFDIIHVNQLNAGLSVLSCATARIAKKPSFLTDHGGGSPFLSAMPQLCAKLPNFFMPVSKYSSKWLESLSPSKKSFIIYGGINIGVFRPNLNIDELKYMFDLEGYNVILYVGKVTPHKGIEVLIKAFQYLPGNTKLLVVGPSRSPEYLAFLKNLAKKYCPGRLILLGGVSDNMLPKFYNVCDVFVLPSLNVDYLGHRHRFPELLGLVKFEAMACAKPVIVSNVGGLPEQVIPGKNGFVFLSGNVKQLATMIKNLLEDNTLKKSMGMAGLRLVQEKFTWRVVANNVLGYYESVLKK